MRDVRSQSKFFGGPFRGVAKADSQPEPVGIGSIGSPHRLLTTGRAGPLVSLIGGFVTRAVAKVRRVLGLPIDGRFYKRGALPLINFRA